MKKILIAILLIGFVVSALGQSNIVVRDLETWTAVELNAKLGPKWSFTLTEQLRLEKNSSMVDQYFTSVDVKYSIINKHLYLGTGYRFICENDTESGFKNEHRFDLDLIYVHSFDRLELSSRLRYQNKNDVGEKASDGDYANQNYRLKLQGDYNIKNWKLDPVISVELFRRYEKYTVPYFDNIRFRVGTNYKIRNYGEIEAFYQIDRELGVLYPQTTYVVGLSYQYKFGNILNKKNTSHE
jgi:hypothetical protein